MSRPLEEDQQVRIQCAASSAFERWMSDAGGSLAVSTYQAGKVAMIGWDGHRITIVMREFDKPLLVIHAEYDHIIPFAEGEALYEACPASHKTLLKVAGADHNTIMAYGLNDYLRALTKLVKSLTSCRSAPE